MAFDAVFQRFVEHCPVASRRSKRACSYPSSETPMCASGEMARRCRSRERRLASALLARARGWRTRRDSTCMRASRSTVRNKTERRLFEQPRPPAPPPSPSSLPAPVVAVAHLVELTRRLRLRDENLRSDPAAVPAAELEQPLSDPSEQAPRASRCDGAPGAVRAPARRGGEA